MSSCEKAGVCRTNAPRAKSPLGTAIVISFAVAAGAVLSTLDAPIFDEITSGRWLTRPFAEAQQRNTAAIASLEKSVGTVTRDLDFVVSRVGASIRRNEDQTSDRFIQLDAEIAALKQKIALIQEVRLAPARVDPLFGGIEAFNARAADQGAEVSGLRSSLHDLAASHQGAVAAITRRLDRIEVMVGLATDVTSSVADPLERRQARREALAAKGKRQISKPETVPGPTAARPERAHMFNIKPISQQGAPLRLSRLPG